MSNFCEDCGQLHEFCLCDNNPESNISRESRTRHELEDYQNTHSLTNDEMTDFINDNEIDF